MNETKQWWKSKTLWFNLATGLVAISSFSGDIINILPESWSDAANVALVVISVIGNTLLRMVTSKGISK